MWMSFAHFCEQQGLPVNEIDLHFSQLSEWQRVFETYVSKDILFKETDPKALVRHYYQETKDYIEKFILHVPDDLTESVPIWDGDNAIHYAAEHGYHHFMHQAYRDYQLAHPEDIENSINNFNKRGMRALHLASGAGHVHTVSVLLDLGADAVLGNKEDILPVFFAAQLPMRCPRELKSRKYDIVKLLLDASPHTLRYVNKKYETIGHILAAYGYTDLLEEIIKKDSALLSLADGSEHRPIHHAILNNRLDTVQCLLELAGDEESNLVGFDGQWPIHYAAIRGTEAMVKLCCNERPQDLNKRDYFGHKALDIAHLEHNHEAEKILENYGDSAPSLKNEADKRKALNK